MGEGKRSVIGVDVGGTTIKALPVAVDQDSWAAEITGPGERCPTPDTDPDDAVLATVAELVESLRADHEPEAVGVVVPGIIDESRGLAVYAANVGWDNTPIETRLSSATGVPVALGHDVRAGGLAEWRLGAGRDARDMLFVALGTGIGSAVITDGRMLSAGGYAGQLGHVIVDPDGDQCTCGQWGCLATVSSASAVIKRYDDPAVTTAREVAERAANGDPKAQEVWSTACDTLADALVVAVTAFGSELVVLGGGLALAGDQLLHPVINRLEARLTFQRRPRVVPAELGDESAILGAALLAAETLAR